MGALVGYFVDKSERIIEKEKLEAVVIDRIKYIIITMYSLFVLFSSLFFNSFSEILEGLKAIALAPSILVTDYIAVGGIGGAAANAGILMVVAVIMGKLNKVEMNGPLIGAVITIGGFAFLGKNIYNVWANFLGVYLYATFRGEKFSKHIFAALFGTALGPIVSQLSFGLGFNPILGVILGNLAGIATGFIMAPLAAHFTKFHQGYSLYNMGFTGGIIGAVFMSLLRAYGKNNEPLAIISGGNNFVLGIYLTFIFSSMLVIGYFLNGKSFKGYKKLLSYSGKGHDFVSLVNFQVALINMGIVGLLSTYYVLGVNGQLNGTNIAGIFAVSAFGSFGKHPRNIIPIFAGVFIASMTQTWEVNSTGPLLAALCGTTLAPLAGKYGWKVGVLAGFTHMMVVMNTSYLHGGFNLYNNGFAGGIVAAFLIALIPAITKTELE